MAGPKNSPAHENVTHRGLDMRYCIFSSLLMDGHAMRKAVIFDRCYIKQNSGREIPAMPALHWHPRKDSFEIGERYPAPLKHVAVAVQGWPEAQGKRLRLHPLKAVSLLALVLRVSWSRGVSTLKLCILLCVFADAQARALSPANSKTGLGNFTEF